MKAILHYNPGHILYLKNNFLPNRKLSGLKFFGTSKISLLIIVVSLTCTENNLATLITIITTKNNSKTTTFYLKK